MHASSLILWHEGSNQQSGARRDGRCCGPADKRVSATTSMWRNNRGTVGNGIFYWVLPEWNRRPRSTTFRKWRDARGISVIIPRRKPRSRTKPVLIPATVKLPSKAALTRKFFAPLRTADVDTETTSVENTTGAGGSQKLGRSPPIVMTSTTNLIRLKRRKRTRQRRVRVPKYMKWNPYHKKRNGGLFSYEILRGEE
jgi:hypothetical protein